MAAMESSARSIRDWAAQQASRLGVFVGSLGIEDIWPTRFQAATLESQVADFVKRHHDSRRERAETLRRRHAEQSTDDLIDHLFQPFLRKALSVSIGGLALDVVPLAVLWENAASLHQQRTLLGQQIDLIAAACLVCDPRLSPDEVAEETLLVLDRVYGLAQIKADLKQPTVARRAWSKGLDKAAWQAARIVMRGAVRWVRAARNALEMYARYSRFRAVRDAIVVRFRERGCRLPSG